MASARLEWTSVPRWPSPELPPAASYLACWFGDAARPPVQALLASANSGSPGATPGVPVRTAAFPPRWDDATETELRRLIGGCRMGVRIVLAGPESIVMRSLAVARQLGASTEELVPIAIEATGAADPTDASADTPGETPGDGGYVSGRTTRRVFCAPCRLTFDAVAAIGGTTACPGCAAELLVDYRFSRPHAAYFGWPTGLDLHR